MILRCGDVVLDFARYEASRGGSPLHLRPKVFSLLAYLAERSDRIVLKQEVHDYLWPDQIVGDSALDTSIKEARRVFGDTGFDQRVIKTIRGRGFRFVGELETLGRPAESGPQSDTSVRLETTQRPFPVTAELPGPNRLPSAFVGRTKDLEILTAKLESAQRGRGRVVGIVGEPGQGKTRLLDELRHRTRRRRYVRGRCSPAATGCSSLLVLDMLRERCGIGADEDRETAQLKLGEVLRTVSSGEASRIDWRAFLLHLLGLGMAPELARLGPRALQLRTFEALHKALVRPSGSEPVVVEVDDLHWIDSYSERWLEWLQRGIMGSPLLLLTSYRPGYAPVWLGRSYASQIALEPLTEAESLRLVEGILSTRVPGESDLRTLVRRAGGNPYFLEELARACAEDGCRSPGTDVPDSIRMLLVSRAARLPQGPRALLDILAVVGAEAPYSLLRSIAALPDSTLHDHLSLLMDHEFLVENLGPTEAAYSFQHALARDAIYQALDDEARKRLHGLVARALAADPSDVTEHRPSLLAHHFAQAGMDEEFADCWLRANERALRLHLVDEAICRLRRGLSILVALPESEGRDQQELSLRVNLAGAMNMSGDHDEATVLDIIARAEELRDRLGDSPRLFWVLSGFVRHYLFRGNISETQRMVFRFRDCGERIGTPEAARITSLLFATYMTLCRFHMGDVAGASRYAEAVLRHAPVPLPSSTSVYLHNPWVLCQVYAGSSSLLRGQAGSARIQCLEAVALARSSAEPWNLAAACTMSAHAHYLGRNHALAVEHAELAEAVCQEHGLRTYGTFVKGILGAERCGRRDLGGIEDIRDSLAFMKRTGWSLLRTGMLANYAEALAATGNVEGGLGALAEAESLFEAGGERFMEPEVQRLRGDLLLQKGLEYADLAEATYRQALRTAAGNGMTMCELRAATSLGRLLAQSGRASDARAIVRPIYEAFTEELDSPDLVAARTLLG